MIYHYNNYLNLINPISDPDSTKLKISKIICYGTFGRYAVIIFSNS